MKHFLIILIFTFSISLIGKENISNPVEETNTTAQMIGAACLDPSSATELNIGNVRTTILGGGDMWWNLSDAQYEVPKNEGVHSLFAGSLWIGGMDNNSNLKIQRFPW